MMGGSHSLTSSSPAQNLLEYRPPPPTPGCQVPSPISKNDEQKRAKADKGLGKNQWRLIWQKSRILISAGAGMC